MVMPSPSLFFLLWLSIPLGGCANFSLVLGPTFAALPTVDGIAVQFLAQSHPICVSFSRVKASIIGAESAIKLGMPLGSALRTNIRTLVEWSGERHNPPTYSVASMEPWSALRSNHGTGNAGLNLVYGMLSPPTENGEGLRYPSSNLQFRKRPLLWLDVPEEEPQGHHLVCYDATQDAMYHVPTGRLFGGEYRSLPRTGVLVTVAKPSFSSHVIVVGAGPSIAYNNGVSPLFILQLEAVTPVRSNCLRKVTGIIATLTVDDLVGQSPYALRLDSHILLVGGTRGLHDRSHMLRFAHVFYDYAAGNWVAKPVKVPGVLPLIPLYAELASWNDNGAIIGGVVDGKARDTVFLFDREGFVSVLYLQFGRLYAAVTVLDKGQVLVCGGGGSPEAMGSCETFSLAYEGRSDVPSTSQLVSISPSMPGRAFGIFLPMKSLVLVGGASSVLGIGPQPVQVLDVDLTAPPAPTASGDVHFRAPTWSDGGGGADSRPPASVNPLVIGLGAGGAALACCFAVVIAIAFACLLRRRRRRFQRHDHGPGGDQTRRRRATTARTGRRSRSATQPQQQQRNRSASGHAHNHGYSLNGLSETATSAATGYVAAPSAILKRVDGGGGPPLPGSSGYTPGPPQPYTPGPRPADAGYQSAPVPPKKIGQYGEYSGNGGGAI